jgi:hypothetical protein
MGSLSSCGWCEEVDRALIYSIFCWLAVLIPWHLKYSSRNRNSRALSVRKRPELSESKIRFVLILFALVGGASYLLVMRLEAVNTLSQWSGPITIFWFFSKLLLISGLSSIFLYHRYRKRVYLIIALAAFCIIFYRFLFLGRRSQFMDLVFYIGGFLYFSRNFVPKLWQIVLVGMFGYAFVIFVGEYRSGLNQGSVIDAIVNLKSAAFGASDKTVDYLKLEALNYVSILSEMSISGEYTHIKTLWNSVVHRYVPAQLVGNDFKSSLTLSQVDIIRATEASGFELAYFGSTITGFSSSFISLGWFGFVWFSVISFAMKAIFFRANQGIIFWQVLYVYMLSNSLHALTHDHYWFFTPLIQFFIFFGLGFVLSRRSPRSPAVR